MTAERKPWDRLDGESPAAYARFRRYLSLGPKRSVAGAAKRASKKKKASKGKKTRPSGQWSADCRAYRWIERAAAWDIEQFARHGEIAVHEYMATIRKATGALLGSLKHLKPETWKDFIDGLAALNNAIPPEVVEEVYRQARAVPKGPASGG